MLGRPKADQKDLDDETVRLQSMLREHKPQKSMRI